MTDSEQQTNAEEKTQQNNSEHSNELQGKYLELDIGGKTVSCQIKSISASPTDSTCDTNITFDLNHLMNESTNQWLYLNSWNANEECINRFIAIIVLLIQIASYVAITYFLVKTVWDEQETRRENCYGPNCNQKESACMVLTTGSLVSIMLVGFLWADVINVLTIFKTNYIASILCLMELLIAIICGFLIGLYSESDFDAIGGAIGILFVHDLDEKVYASMELTKSSIYKKLLAVFLWIVVSISLSFSVACQFTNGSYFSDAQNQCLNNAEFQCSNGECIWNGFICNGVFDCVSGQDEGSHCNYELIQCPIGYFVCINSGVCLPENKRCNGIIDCIGGTDEGRSQNCSNVIDEIQCDKPLIIDYKYKNNSFYQIWSGQFKCSNGQCVDASFACDGIPNDCTDSSDEYPFYNQLHNYPYLQMCPYSQLMQCDVDQVLCKRDGKCISKNVLCDGILDCSDGADENGCTYSCNVEDILSMNTFQCGGSIASINDTHIVLFASLNNPVTIIPYSTQQQKHSLVTTYTSNDKGLCINYEWRCDGIQDCDNGSDESLCTLFKCNFDEYQCPSNGECIPQQWLCDYTSDCIDETDEQEQICDQYGKSFEPFCAENQYKCEDYLICIPESHLCDKNIDCPKKDDENNCVESLNPSVNPTHAPNTESPTGYPTENPTTKTPTKTANHSNMFGWTCNICIWMSIFYFLI
eukprot:375538_1